jgi:hypothetical protein
VGLEERIAVQRQLADRSTALVDQVVAAVVAQVPAYAVLTGTQLGEIAAIAGWATGRLTEMWVDGSALGERDLHRFRGIGAARAVDGRPLMAVLRAYRVAAIALNDVVAQLAPPALTVADVAALNRVLLGALDDLSEALFQGYQHKDAELETDRDRLLAELLHDLLTGRQTSPGALADRTERLGVRIPDRVTLLVVTHRSAAAVSPEQVAALVASLTEPATATAGARGPDRPPAGTGSPRAAAGVRDSVLTGVRDGFGVALVLDPVGPPAEALRVALHGSGWRGCLLTGTSPAALPADFTLASAGLGHAPLEAFTDARLLRRADAMMVAILRGEPVVDRAGFAAEALGPLLEQRHGRLLAGLGGYVRHGSATEAAAALGLHPQTMRHRLRRIGELTGRRLGDSWDRLVLETARGAVLTRSATR